MEVFVLGKNLLPEVTTNSFCYAVPIRRVPETNKDSHKASLAFIHDPQLSPPEHYHAKIPIFICRIDAFGMQRFLGFGKLYLTS